MKKFLLVAFCAMFAIVSCEETLPSVDDIDKGIVTPEDPSQGGQASNALQPDEQKAKFSSVGEKFLEKCDPEDFSKFSDLAESFEKNFVDVDYDWSALEDWAEKHVDGFTVTDNPGQKIDGKLVIENFEELIFVLSNYKGLFTLGKDKLTVSDYDGVKIVFSMDGKNYEATVEYNGKETTALLVTSYIYEDNYSETAEIHKSTSTISITVPEETVVRVTENGSDLMTITIKAAASLTQSGLVLTTDGLAIQTTVSMNGYEYVIENMSYNGSTSKVGVNQKFTKDGETLISLQGAGDLTLDIEKQVYEDEYWRDEEDALVAKKANNFSASADIMGEIQIFGTCSDAISASESLDAMWDALYDGSTPNLSTAERHLNNFNAKFDFGVYYDKGNNKQAKVEFELDKQTYDYGWDVNGDGIVNGNDVYTDYDLVPVIVFNDNSRYMVEEFFAGNAFNSLIEAFESYCEKLSEIFGYFVEDKELIENVPMY